MVTNRPYRKAYSREKAIDEIEKNSGKQFSPIVSKIFLKMLKNDNFEYIININ